MVGWSESALFEAEMIRVHITDDHPLLLEGIKRLFARSADLDLVGESKNGADALAALEQGDVDVLLLDLDLPDMSGLQVLRQVHVRHPAVQVLFLSGHPVKDNALEVIRAGAAGYLTKDLAPDELLAAIRQVATGRPYITPDLAQEMFTTVGKTPAAQPPALSERELEVLRLIASGARRQEIADRLGLSVKTVSAHRARIQGKLNLRTNADFARYAVTNGLA